MIKGILNTSHNNLEIPRTRLITGILIGLFFSIAFYSFLYLTREVFRILSVTEDYDLWVLTDKEVNFYNLFFSYISVIISQSVCFAIWFDRPDNFFEKKYYRKTTIVNDQRVLNWFFLSWFSKLGIGFGLFYGLVFYKGFYVFSFYPDYNYVFILIIIVLFLQTWNTIRLTFKSKSLKWMLLSGAIISLLAFGLSRINLIDYKAINQKYLAKNIHYNYRLELPETNFFVRLSPRSLIEDIYVVKSNNPIKNEPLIIVDNQEIDLYELMGKIIEWQSIRDKYDKCNIIYQLHIDKSIRMKFINQLKNELAKAGATRVAFAVVPKKPEYDIRFYKDFSFQTRIPNYILANHRPQAFYKAISHFQNPIHIKLNISGKCTINNKPVEDGNIKPTLSHLIANDTNYIIKLYVNDNVAFSDYLRVVSYPHELVKEFRNWYSEVTYLEHFDRLDYKSQDEVISKYPLRIVEMTTEFKTMINEE